MLLTLRARPGRRARTRDLGGPSSLTSAQSTVAAPLDAHSHPNHGLLHQGLGFTINGYRASHQEDSHVMLLGTASRFKVILDPAATRRPHSSRSHGIEVKLLREFAGISSSCVCLQSLTVSLQSRGCLHLLISCNNEKNLSFYSLLLYKREKFV